MEASASFRSLICFTLLYSSVQAWSLPALEDFPLTTSGNGLPSIPGLPSLNWQAELEKLWETHKERFSYCVGDSLAEAWALLQASFPMPLLTDTTDDSGVCSNGTAIYLHLCGPQEVAIYLKYLLLTDNVEKIPSNAFCDVGNEAASCAPGFFQLLSVDPLAPSLLKSHACCPGYFCPAMLTCMLPCPYGAICPRAHPADPPASYIEGDPDIIKSLLRKADRWCAPYGYKMRSGLGCGGADKWTVQPMGAFPTTWYWEGGSGSIYCQGGRYCPNPLTSLPCTEGHFCKQGSSSISACPALTDCPEGTETPTNNYIGFVLDGCLFLLLALMWHVSKVYDTLMRRLSSRERVHVLWHNMAPQVTVVEAAEEQQPQQQPMRSRAASLAGTSAAAAGGASVATGSRFGFICDLARRRSRAGTVAAAMAPVWASIDGRNSQTAPLLEYEMQGEDERRAQSVGGVRLAANATPTLDPVLKALKPAIQQQRRGSRDSPRAAGALARQSSEDEGLIPVGHYEAAADAAAAAEGMRIDATEVIQFVGAGVGYGAAGGGRPLLDVGFENLSMSLKSCRKQVLQGITGHLKHGRVTAIMGPSGAGKTTLMNALAGKASYGVVLGTITINGKPSRLDRHKRLLGFVPQDDIMYRNLTVEENHTYSARFRLPSCTTAAKRLEVVASTIEVLGLGDVRHALIGDEEVRGISGGQRKRVNVGLELVAQPSLLFLDEPTSGLDSTASKLVVQGLKRVAQTGVTVSAVIHQPSYETFCLFDDLVLLAKGGVTAYCGPHRDVRGYFEDLGFEIPEHMNPADAYLDIISGSILTKTGQNLDIPASWRAQQALGAGPGDEAAAAPVAGRRYSSSSMDETAATGPEAASHAAKISQQLAMLLSGMRSALLLWVAVVGSAVHDAISSARNAAAGQLQSWASTLAARGSSSSGAGRPAGVDGSGSAAVTVAALSEHSSWRRPPGFCRQFWWCLTRQVLMRTREPVLVFIEYAIFAVVGSFLGLMSDRGRGSIASYVGNVVYNIVALGLMAMVSGIKTFGGPERLVYYREAASGLNRLAYFCALDAFGHAGMLMRCAVYLVMYYTFSQPRAVVWQMYVVTAAIYYACTGMAYMLSQAMQPNAAQLAAAVVALINALVASKFSTTGVMGMLNSVSYARWGLEGYVIAEANRLTGVWLLARCADLSVFSYDVRHFWYAMKTLFNIGVLSRVMACLGLLLLNRDKTV